MRLLQISIGVMFMVALTCGLALGAQYYLSPDGDDEAAGTRDAPWRSLTKANATLEAGDTATFLPGEYTGSIAPARSGAADAPITLRSAERWAASLSPGDEPVIIRLDDREHVTIDGFHVDAETRANWGEVTNSRHITIRGCEMRRSGRTMAIEDCSQVRLLDNVFSADRTSGDMLHVRRSNQVLLEGNSATRVGHCPLRIEYCADVVVRSNVFRNEWGRNYEFWYNSRLLIEGNIITRARDSAGSADSRAKNLYEDSIFRHNLVFGNLHTPMNSGSYLGARAGSTRHGYGPFVTVNSRFYHNTIAENIGHGWELNGINVSSNVFKNNIFFRNDYTGGGTQVVRGDGISRDNRFVTNILRGTEAGQTVVRYGSEDWTLEEAHRNTRRGEGFWSEFYENIDADPAFVDGQNRDFRLMPDSPAVDGGTPLTWAIGEGTGRELPVSDGRWFYDGLGIEGEEGDWIAIGSGENLAQIERIEHHSYQPTILHLDREVGWEDAMPVSLPWAGEGPDIGAIEHGGRHPTRLIALAHPAAVEPGEPVRFSLDTLSKDVASVTWDFDDGTVSREMEPTHTFEEHGHYGVTARATFADGRRGIAPVFVHVPRRLDPQAPLVEVDFEDATHLDTWGYHFKFYRSWLTGYERVEREIGAGHCIRLFYDANKSNRAAGAIAPGAWEIDAYPIIRFAYRIPEGVPVALYVEAFEGTPGPGGWVLGGTEARNVEGYLEVEGPTLIDDNQWHEAEVDLRAIRDATPEARYLRRFMFRCNWREDNGQQFRFDDFSILPE
ncbi:MAG: right-handed parallel beta-helix repeat-containing protein [Armatimonadota bacterium]|jgi:hypothetical protein